MTRRRKRSKLLIIADVLDYLLKEGGSDYATRIATGTGLAYDRLSNLLEELDSRGIVRVRDEDGRKKVEITEKGVKLLENVRRLWSIIRDFGLDL